MSSGALQKLIGSVVRMMVDHPQEVVVTPVEEGRMIVFELEVAEEDIGRVIGRQGRTSRSLRALLAAAARENSGRYQLEILE
jgi:predicted RNA-binding protein YlqC (UPF0109 family)